MDASEICRSIDNDLIYLIHNIVLLIKIAVPIVLVILGMIDFAKGVIASKEDEIKKGQQTFFKRVIAAFIVFFIVTIVQLLMSFVSDDGGVWTCANQILNGVPNPEVSEKVDDKNTENKGTEQKQTQTKEETDNNISEDSNVSCDSSKYYREYNKCLELDSSSSVCATYFQDVCTSKTNVSLMWKTASNYSSNQVKDVTCKLSDHSEAEFLKKQVYTCATYTMLSNSGGSFDSAVNRCITGTTLSYYCNK